MNRVCERQARGNVFNRCCDESYVHRLHRAPRNPPIHATRLVTATIPQILNCQPASHFARVAQAVSRGTGPPCSWHALARFDNCPAVSSLLVFIPAALTPRLKQTPVEADRTAYSFLPRIPSTAAIGGRLRFSETSCALVKSLNCPRRLHPRRPSRPSQSLCARGEEIAYPSPLPIGPTYQFVRHAAPSPTSETPQARTLYSSSLIECVSRQLKCSFDSHLVFV